MRIHIIETNQVTREIEIDQINSRIVSGELDPDSLGWMPGMSEWAPLRSISAVKIPTPPPVSNSHTTNNSSAVAIDFAKQKTKYSYDHFSLGCVWKAITKIYVQLVPFKTNLTEGDSLWDTKGRIGRLQYIMRILLIHLLSTCIVLPIILLGTALFQNHAEQIFTAVMWIVILLNTLLIVPHSAKRLHDIGVGGEAAIFGFLPVFGLILYLGLSFWPGQAGQNKYG